MNKCDGIFHLFVTKEEKIDQYGKVKQWMECPCGFRTPEMIVWSAGTIDLIYSHIFLIESKLQALIDSMKERKLI